MNSTHINIEQLQSAFSEYLKKNKLRYTTERGLIFARICQTNAPFTPDIVKQLLEDERFYISRASVYNTFKLLIDAEIIVSQQLNGATQYTLKCPDEQNLQAVCKQCGKTQNISDENMREYLSKYKIPKFTIESYTLQFYGVCSKCKYRIIYQKHADRKKLPETENKINS